jgi:hypothetical protein
MVTHITGQSVDNDNDPVEVRQDQLINSGSPLLTALGTIPSSPIWYDTSTGPSQHFWRYWPNGMIVWGLNTCACVIYGPVMDLYDQLGQFRGPLGAAATDVSTLPDGTTFAVFEQGVIWVDSSGSAHQLVPLSPSFVQSVSGVDPSINGIAALAQSTVQTKINSLLQSNQQAKDNISSVTVTASFEGLGPGGCFNASFNSAGKTVPRSHVFALHVDAQFSGCAGIFGGVNIDLHVTVRLSVTPPTVSAFLVSYTIDNIGTPFGIGQAELAAELTNALNAEFNQDLVGKTLPTGITVIAALVDEMGNVNIFIEPICAPSQTMQGTGSSGPGLLRQMRQLRDEQLAGSPDGRLLIQAVEALGPVITEAMRRQPDGRELQANLSGLLETTFSGNPDLSVIAEALEDPSTRARRLLSLAVERNNRNDVDRIVEEAISFVRHKMPHGRSFEELSRSLSTTLEQLEQEFRVDH